MKTRQERLTKINEIFIIRRAEDSQRKQPDAEIAKNRCLSWERHLTSLGVVPDDYEKVYELATVVHNEKGANGPFGIDEIIQGAQRFLKSNEPQMTVEPFVKDVKNKNECTACNGTGLEFDGAKIKFEMKEGKRIPVKCKECYER